RGMAEGYDRRYAARVASDAPAGEPARLPEALDVLHGSHGERGEHHVVGDEVRPDVGAASAPIAPGGERPEDRRLPAGEALPSLDGRVALLGRHVGEAARVLEAAE